LRTFANHDPGLPHRRAVGRLERLQSASAGTDADLAQLRHRVETRPAIELPAETTRALALADRLCWDSLSNGDTAAFDRQAALSADLRAFGICARLPDE
jgi:hypothetical protein